MHKQDVSIRALARRWRPETLEPARRSLHRYLDAKHLPSATIREELAEALGLDAERFLGDEDEEDDVVAELISEFVAVLVKRVREEARASFDKRIEELV